MQCDYGAFKMQAVLNGEGTQFHAKGFMPGQIISCDWLSEEKLETLKEDRDPADAPRYHSCAYPVENSVENILENPVADHV